MRPFENQSPPITTGPGPDPIMIFSINFKHLLSIEIDYLIIVQRKIYPKKSLNDWVQGSVTRLGDILQLWRAFLSLWQFLDCFFHVGKNFEPTLALFYGIGQMFIVVNVQILIE